MAGAASAEWATLAFFVDGNQVDLDASAPYSVRASIPLAEGSHSMFVQGCAEDAIVYAWSNFETLAAGPRVSAGRIVKVSIGVGNSVFLEDYDIGKVRITRSYAVLR